MGLNGDLCSDIVGTSPVYPKIVDHSWLDVDLSKYDNYPSDNQPLRVVPKLHDLWSHASAQTGVNLVPNAMVMPLGIRSSEEDVHAVDQVVKEAKKAVMAGLKGRNLSEYLRARFSSKHITMAQGALKKVAEEVGLLGNVYIDASAFSTYDEAEKFLSQHRTRLARDILMNTEGLNHSVISMLANNFHKNVVASVEYTEDMLKKYRDHLVQAKRIPEDMVIASKEDLRKAFLYEKVEEVITATEAPEKRLSEDQAKQAAEKLFHDKAIADCEARDSVLLSKVSPIIAFVQENLAKGKTAAAIKEMVKSRYALSDVKDAAEALVVTLSKEGLAEEHVDSLVKEGKVSLVMGSELKRIGKKFPIKEAQEFSGAVEAAPSVGLQGYLYVLDGKRVSDQFESIRTAAVKALKKGFDIESIKGKILQKISIEDANRILAEAVSIYNSMPAGVLANQAMKAPKAVVIEEPAPKQTLPDPSTIVSQLQELEATFDGSMMNEIDIDPTRNYSSVEIAGLFNRDGLDKNIA
jgi:hypothetical protein